MNKRIRVGLLAAVLGFSLAARGLGPALAASGGYTRTYDPQNNTIVYTISSGAGDWVTINCNDVANSLMAGLSLPGQASQVAVRFVNNSSRTYVFEDYAFTTENGIERDVPVASPGLPTTPGYTIRTQPPLQDGAITSQRGFDGNLIPYPMTVLRSVTTPLKAAYGIADSADVTVLQVLHLEDRLAELGYDSYSEYLLDYYKQSCTDPTHRCRQAASLLELDPSHQCEILGSNSFGYTGQSEIRQPRTISIAELQTNPAYYDFRVYGWGTRVTGATGERRVEQDYEIMETDPEIIALGYRYLYAYGLFFSFDGTGIEMPASPEELALDNLEIWSYLNRLDSVEKQVDVLERIVLEPGASVTLPNVTLEVQLPNSYDMRSIDFGFSLSFVTADGPGPVDPPGPTDSPGPTDPPGPTDSPDPTAPPGPDNPDGPVNPPKTGDTSHLNLWLAILGAAILLLGFVLIKMRNERHQP
ncbi:LPXTG cell wall anchor domain-containing protein [uncultured Flavonifractor sp.]|uniref:LPXTG cell wall anchor domain-containing protein n=1 Tax=uncultured Flavonifractor sp. TaxID=1193534 RepID=UPI0026337783|nr:LPXTG cell wall anchor domain-containing protein [uncultured Flavonifractor sp.]